MSNNSNNGNVSSKSVKIDSTIQKFYSSLNTPIFFCVDREILWHNDAAKLLFENRHFRQYVLQLKKPKSETTKSFICDEFYYKILMRPFDDAFFLEVIEHWSLSSTFDSSLSAFDAPEVLDTVVRNSSHQIFQAVSSLSKIMEGLGNLSNLKHLDEVANATYRMLRATNLYYEYNLLMQGKMNTEIVDIFSEIDALCSTVNSLMQKSGVSFSWTVPEDKLFCDIDMHKFGFALFHLICNAYMFTSPKNEVKVVAQKCDDGLIKVEIIDKGAGISAGILDKVINPYFSYDSVTGDVAGCGLGLTYASVFVKNSGGTLTISSEGGETVVSILMPVVAVPDSAGFSSHVADYEMGRYYYMVSTMSNLVLDF